ncbi:MAG: TIM barrel protein [bacterium]|nr:TIM barrel protein [bacterium]
MPKCRVGAHTFIFQQYGFDQVKQLGKILETIAEAGYQAVELTNTALENEAVIPQVESTLRRTNLELIGASHGKALWNPAEYDRTFDILDEYSDRLVELGEGLKCGMSCSGKQYAKRTKTENECLLQAWTELASMFRAKDLELAYHTHGEPLEDILYVLENIPAEELNLCPDIDWLRVGGVDPEPFLREHAERISMIHLRDYHLGGDRTVSLGQGDLDLGSLGTLLDEVEFTGDVVVELALPSGTRPDDHPLLDLLKTSREHLRSTMGV